MTRPALTPGEHGGGKPKSETALVFPWLVPQPRPEPESESEVTSVTPMVNVVSSNPPPSQSVHDHGDRPGSKSSGQGSSSGSGEQGGTGASQNRGEASQVIDEIPDFAELGLMDTEPLPTSAAPEWPGSRPLTVGQEMHVDHLLSTETNILVREVLIGIKREGMPSRAYVSDFISQFAEWGWDDLSGALALQILKTVRNSDWDFTLEGVRQFVELDLAATALDEDEAERYELMLEKVFEFYIEWGTTNTNKLTQLQNLAKANVHIVDYLENAFVNDKGRSGLTVYHAEFSQTKQGKLQVYLGADDKLKHEDIGSTPYWGSNTDKLYLGSAVNIATIVHEFGHVLDRNLDIAINHLRQGSKIPAWKEWRDVTGSQLGISILENVIESFGAKQLSDSEIWSDLFMTAVLDPSNPGIHETYEVLSTTYESLSKYIQDLEDQLTETYRKERNLSEEEARKEAKRITAGAFYDCKTVPDADCSMQDVKWVEDYNVKHTVLPKDQFPILLKSLLSG